MLAYCSLETSKLGSSITYTTMQSLSLSTHSVDSDPEWTTMAQMIWNNAPSPLSRYWLIITSSPLFVVVRDGALFYKGCRFCWASFYHDGWKRTKARQATTAFTSRFFNKIKTEIIFPTFFSTSSSQYLERCHLQHCRSSRSSQRRKLVIPNKNQWTPLLSWRITGIKQGLECFSGIVQGLVEESVCHDVYGPR
jgi:hypothetical protein